MTPPPPRIEHLAQIRAEYDAEMRRNPPVDPEEHLERTDRLVRVVGRRAWVAFSELTEAEAAERVRAEASWARRSGVELEWKLFEYDAPKTLAGLLRANAFVPDPPESLMVYDLRDGPAFPSSEDSVAVRQVVDPEGLNAAVEVSRTAFAPGPGWDHADYLPRLGSPSFRAFVAFVAGRPVSAGRLELPDGRHFASLWGGGTTPAYRGRGVYRALVGARAEAARTRGYRYLTVDARESSRPILERLGFQRLAGVVGWIQSA